MSLRLFFYIPALCFFVASMLSALEHHAELSVLNTIAAILWLILIELGANRRAP